MGLFSFLCNRCHMPLLSSDATTKGVNEWMSQATRVAGNLCYSGEYDGYGRINDRAIEVGEDGNANEELYHYDCWILVGAPRLQTVEKSMYAEDQGWFFDKGAYDVPSPLQTLRFWQEYAK